MIEVCQTSSCWLNGAEDIVRFIEKKLNIKNGETTEDGMFTIKTVAVSYTHLRAHETVLDLVCRLLLEKKKN